MDYGNEYSGMEVFAIKTTMPFERGLEGLEVFGSPGRTRTCDQPVNSRLLYQLSYRGTDGLLSGSVF